MTLYLYALVDSPPRADLGTGIAKRRLQVVRARGAWVIVERSSPPPISPAALRAHDRVVRRIARACPAILPLRFGSAAQDRYAVIEMLLPFARSLDAAFERVRGCVELTIRVSGRPTPPRPRKTGGPGTRWLSARFAARQVPEIAPITAATRPFVRETQALRHEKPIGDAHILASVYHLVPKAKVAAWRKAVARGARLLDGVAVTTSGPWPPYTFAELP